MLRLAGPWLLRSLSTGKQPWRCQVRKVQHWPRVIKKIPMRNKFPQYEISNLVLDLDAEDSKYVRKYDEEVDGVPEGRFAKRARAEDALKQRVGEFNDLYEKDEARSQFVLSNKGGAWQISDLDVMSLTLGDLPRSADASTTSQSRSSESTDRVQIEALNQAVLDWNGIPQHTRDSFTKAMPYTLRRQYLGRQKASRSYDERWLSERLSSCLHFTELKRLIINVMQTSNGAQLVAQCSGEIGSWCYAYVPSVESSTLKDILVFINDVYLHLTANHQEVSPRLLQTGLLLALRCNAFPAAREFLCPGLTRGPSHRIVFTQVLKEELEKILQSLEAFKGGQRDVEPPMAVYDYRVAVYSLLTGQGPCGLSYPSSLRAVCLQADDFSVVLIEVYLHILAELGAIRTFWHELHRWKTTLSSNVTASSTNLADILAGLHHSKRNGFLDLALLRFSSNIRDGQLALSASDLADATGQFALDCQMDLRNIMQSSVSVTASESMQDAGPSQSRGKTTDAPDDRHHPGKGFSAGVIARKLSIGLSDAINRPTIQETMSALCTTLFEKPTVQGSMDAFRAELFRKRKREQREEVADGRSQRR